MDDLPPPHQTARKERTEHRNKGENTSTKRKGAQKILKKASGGPAGLTSKSQKIRKTRPLYSISTWSISQRGPHLKNRPLAVFAQGTPPCVACVLLFALILHLLPRGSCPRTLVWAPSNLIMESPGGSCRENTPRNGHARTKQRTHHGHTEFNGRTHHGRNKCKDDETAEQNRPRASLYYSMDRCN